MVRVTVVIRELNRQKPDYSLPFDLPEVPKVGDYISIYRPDSETHTEDVVVRHVWWQLYSPEDRATVSGDDLKIGKAQDILVECDVAVGPFARDDWRRWADAAKIRGATVEEFQVERFTVTEADLKRMQEK